MLGIKDASSAVANSADAITAFVENANDSLSELSSQVKASAQLVPYVIAGSALLSVLALIVSLVALSQARRD